MSAFQYVAVNAEGKEQKGIIDAESEREARHLLRDQALMPLSVRETHAKKVGKESHFLWRRERLSSKAIALFTRQFATLLTAGLPVEECLKAVAEQNEKPRLKGLILSVRSKVMEGHALAHALGEHPDAFSALFCATVAAGEKSGHLDKVLLRLADYTEQQWHMQQKLKTALIYPVMIVFVAVGIVGFLLAYVVPKMVAVYSNLGQSLPAMTQLLIVVSDFVKQDGVYFVLAFLGSILIGRHLLKRNQVLLEKAHAILLRLPFIGYLLKTTNTARFARTLSILSASGVPVLEAMNIAAALITELPMKRAVSHAVQRVREGAAIYLALKQTSYFPPMSIHMIASGEASGQLENMLERVAIHQEEDVVRLIEVTLALFEPAVILLMGAIVLFIVLAVLLPIFQLNQMTG